MVEIRVYYIDGTLIRHSRQALQNHWSQYQARSQTMADMPFELRRRGAHKHRTRCRGGGFGL